MPYNEYEKDLQDLENLPSIKNPRRINTNTNTTRVDKVNNLILRELEKRIKELEKQTKSLILDVDRLSYRQRKVSKKQNQIDNDLNNERQNP